MAQNTQTTQNLNEVKLTGTLGTQQITPTFSKQVLYINAKDTKDNQWKQAEMEIYIKPELKNGAIDGDKINITGWLAFNFWNDRSFPRIVVTSVEVIEKGQGASVQTTQSTQPTNPAFNAPQSPQTAQPTNPAPQPQMTGGGGPQIPQAPSIPTPPGM
jgi:hypothetical protein